MKGEVCSRRGGVCISEGMWRERYVEGKAC